MTIKEVIETLQVWIATADDEYDREEMGRIFGLKEALHEIQKIKSCTDVLNKIRAEIKKAIWEDVVVSLDGTDEVRIPLLDPDDVFEIIDKYIAESGDEK